MKPFIWIVCLIFLATLLHACAGDSGSTSSESSGNAPAAPAKVDDGKGIGETKAVALNSPLDRAMVERGTQIYEMKCAACHKLTDKRVVGPGWKGVTDRRKPEWIMNMTTNVEVMLAEDPVARQMLKECLVQMPNQNLSTDDARDVLEYMYANDGQAVTE